MGMCCSNNPKVEAGNRSFPQKPIKLWYVPSHDEKERNTFQQLQKELEEMGCGAASIGVIEVDHPGLVLDANYTNAIMCSNIIFNGNATYLTKLVQDAATLDDLVVFLVEKTLYKRKDIAEIFVSRPKNIAVISNKQWEEKGLNSMEKKDIAKTLYKAVMKKAK